MEAMAVQPDLFAPDAEPAGFRYVPDLLTEAEERDLLVRLEALPFHEVRTRGVAARRTMRQSLSAGVSMGFPADRLSPRAGFR